jgi:tetratricopeptide (TPR) repeat protein
MKYILIFLTAFLLIQCGNSEPTKKLPKDLESLLTMFPDSIPLLLKHGNLKIKESDFEKAMADAARAYRLDSTNLDVRMLYADVLNNRPQRSVAEVLGAQRQFEIIVAKEPNNVKGLVGLASTYSQQQNFEESFKYVNAALRIDPRYRDAYVMKGSNFLLLGKIDLAKSSYETAVQQDPEFYEAYLMLGALYQAENNKICLEYYTTAASLQPNNPDVLYSLAYAKQVFSQPEEAMGLYRKMIQLDTAYSVALFQQGYIKQFIQEDIDSAMYFYNSTLTSDPRFVEAWHNLGLCYKAKGDKTRALQSFGKALKYDPEFTLSREEAGLLK